MTTNPQDLDALAGRADIMAGMLRTGERIAYGTDADMICALSVAITTLRRDLLAAEERGIQIGLRAAVQSLRTWQASLVQHRMSETAITVGMSADVVLILTPDEARKMGEV